MKISVTVRMSVKEKKLVFSRCIQTSIDINVCCMLELSEIRCDFAGFRRY